LFGDGEPVVVDLLVDAGHVEGALAALGSDATVDGQPGGGAIVHVPVVDRAAFRQVVLDLLEHGEVLAPTDVRDDVIAWIERVAAHHRKRVRSK
jgi:hypothetical protein